MGECARCRAAPSKSNPTGKRRISEMTRSRHIKVRRRAMGRCGAQRPAASCSVSSTLQRPSPMSEDRFSRRSRRHLQLDRSGAPARDEHPAHYPSPLSRISISPTPTIGTPTIGRNETRRPPKRTAGFASAAVTTRSPARCIAAIATTSWCRRSSNASPEQRYP